LSALILFLIVLLIIGGPRLADLGKSLGIGVRNFKKGLAGSDAKPKAAPKEPKLLPAKGQTFTEENSTKDHERKD
jgi:Sec-independent protein translocase protein TatA